MKKIGNILALAAVLAPVLPASAAAPQKQPKLVVAIIVDQFRYDYTTRFRSRYEGGLAKLLNEGAVYVDAHQDHFPTVTATGHSAYLSGGVPATTGIISNEWYDRATGKTITSVEDAKTTLIGVSGNREGSSPHNLIVSTRRRVEDRGPQHVEGHRDLDEGPRCDPSRGTHGGRGLLGRWQRSCREQHVVSAAAAWLGRVVQRGAARPQVAWRGVELS
jgi:hypothetical protein